jgi:hypothetical protein
MPRLTTPLPISNAPARSETSPIFMPPLPGSAEAEAVELALMLALEVALMLALALALMLALELALIMLEL